MTYYFSGGTLNHTCYPVSLECYSRTSVAHTIRHRSYDRCRSYDTTYSRKRS